VRLVQVRRPRVALEHDRAEAIPDRNPDAFLRLDRRLAIEEALAQLPAVYREAVVFCHLEGLTHEEAADRLGCPVGTVRSRLARGRALLRHRLAGSGLAPLGWLSHSAAPSDGDAAPAAVAPLLIETTARTAARLATGRPMAEIVSARLTEIVAGVARTMMISKVATASSLCAVTALAAWGALVLAARQAPQPGSLPAPTPAAAPALLTVAAAQAPGEAPRKGRGRQDNRNAEAELQMLAEFPAVVVHVEPKLGASDVDPGLREIRVTFSKRMKDQNWSWVTFNPDMFPNVEGKIHYEADRRTCVLPVKLEPGKTYWIGINSERFHNFKDLDGRPALPYQVIFRTKAAR
jgi:RNA polymerase sigma-70 factor (ECF subfamily)